MVERFGIMIRCILAILTGIYPTSMQDYFESIVVRV